MGRKIAGYFSLGFILIFSCVACQVSSPDDEEVSGSQTFLIVSSTAIAEGGEIPLKHTCDGDDISPRLSWSGTPEGAQSLVLIVDDPDAPAGTFVHWVIYDLPADTGTLTEGVSDLGTQGSNDFRKLGYGGPCPPKGTAHSYFFKIYALDKQLNLQPGATKAKVEQAMQGHILANGQLMGTYKR